MMVQFADGFQDGLHLVIVVQPLLDQGFLLGAETDLPGSPAGIADAEDQGGVAAAGGALGAALAMANGAFQQGAAEEEGEVGEASEELLAGGGDGALIHHY
jgi:hypothetical protein